MRIGIGGYSGSGKSTCAHLLCAENCDIIDGDAEGKALMSNDRGIQKSLFDSFGPSVLKNGTIDFPFLSQTVFSCPDKLKLLNSIVHPPLIKVLKDRIDRSTFPVKILDAALIPLWKIESWFDICLWVEAPIDIKTKRIRSKNPTLENSLIQNRIEFQKKLFPPPQGFPWKFVDNSGDIDALKHSLLKNEFSDLIKQHLSRDLLNG